MLHMVKLAVGVGSIAELAQRQQPNPPVPGDGLDGTAPSGQPWLRTRMYPRRAGEILEGGSLYRVIAGMIMCRQRITGIRPDTRDDGVACALITLDPLIVPVAPRSMRPFQGWRYLRAADAPPDLGHSDMNGDILPDDMRRELAALCLI
ncbi:DUF1489 family protein [Novacetimonas pomaceti]|uniref:DUF1489 domain-containing protein n=1 Tax=Novacetimonas pomaceti TaxID=2021998 RepID=A0A318QK96_9PROT|nr:DUF1489 domain-containing protein [Novacetimonas pomaceti]MBV1832666.1 DUF1489 domain-containing protein [Novacetimonas pomaceti]PYD49050.1 DUF1489 domain-containing protein [Novacetimonas pomaceti]PYD75709.1 hypothetical protein CFR71_07860 [Novacetimonas pomaceti]